MSFIILTPASSIAIPFFLLTIGSLVFHLLRKTSPQTDNTPPLYRATRDGKNGRSNPREYLAEAYKMNPKSPFQVEFPEGRFLLFPRQLASHVANLGDDVTDSRMAELEHFMAEYTFPYTDDLIGDTDRGVKVLRRYLKSLTGHHGNKMGDYAESFFQKEFPHQNEWADMLLFPKFLRLSALLSNTIFLPPSLRYDETIIDAEITFLTNLIKSAFILHLIPRVLRPIARYLLPSLWNIRRAHASLVKILKAVNAETWTFDPENPFIMAQYKKLLPEDSKSMHRMADGILTGSLVALSTVTGALYRAVCELAQNPVCVDLLREEVEEVLSRNSGRLNEAVVKSMPKLDSFLKEMHRLYPGSLISVRRTARHDFTLCGVRVPKGMTMALPLWAISRDPAIYEDPLTFNPLRFYDAITTTKNPAMPQYPELSLDYLVFGAGKHACPGRYLASTQLKISLAIILRDYDVTLGEGQTEKPPTVSFGTLLEQELDVPLRVRRRR